MIPYANARLTALHEPGATEDYDAPAADGSLKWSGNLPAYLAEQKLAAVNGGALDELIQTTLTIPRLFDGADVEPEDRVTYVYAGAELHRRVRHVQRFDALGTVRATLWDA